MADAQPKGAIGLFVTCLVDAMRPSIGFAAIKLLEAAGYSVVVPKAQTCCGQPAFNSGDDDDARGIACRLIEAFEPFDYVVAPSGSCAGMIREHVPLLFKNDPYMADRAQALAAKTFEIVSFLHDVADYTPSNITLNTTATYHDSCSGLRELGIQAQPRALLAAVDGLRLTPLPDADVCCGFGGTFCVKYPEISEQIVAKKTAAIASTEAELLLAGDLGCLMNMAGRLKREGKPTRCYHVIEVLAGMADTVPAIGEGH